MNSLIEKIFANFIVDDVLIPIGFITYKGKSEAYITYQSIMNVPSFNLDNEVVASVEHFDIDIYSKGNYLKIMESVKTIMKNNGFTWIEDSSDMYEEDTGYYHKTIEFAIERMI